MIFKILAALGKHYIFVCIVPTNWNTYIPLMRKNFFFLPKYSVFWFDISLKGVLQ